MYKVNVNDRQAIIIVYIMGRATRIYLIIFVFGDKLIKYSLND